MGQDHPNFKGAWLEDMGGWDGPLKRICSQIWDEPIRENQPDRFIPISLHMTCTLHCDHRFFPSAHLSPSLLHQHGGILIHPQAPCNPPFSIQLLDCTLLPPQTRSKHKREADPVSGHLCLAACTGEIHWTMQILIHQ